MSKSHRNAPKAAPVKKWAYLHPTGDEWISAQELATLRDSTYLGRTDRRTYYSQHPSGYRYEMSFRHGALRQDHFAYKGGSPGLEDPQGESPQHKLFKDSFKTVKRFKLKLAGHVHTITALSGATEYRVKHPSGRYYDSDARLRFSSDTLLDLKWNQILHLEVYHRHLTVGDKIPDFLALGMSLVEIGIPDKLLLKNEHDFRTATRDAYKDNVRAMLENFDVILEGTLLADPSSELYQRIDAVIEEADKRTKRTIADLNAANRQIEATNRQVEQLRKENRALVTERDSTDHLREKVSLDLNQSETNLAKAISALQHSQSDLAMKVQQNGELHERLRYYRLRLIGISVALAVIALACIAMGIALKDKLSIIPAISATALAPITDPRRPSATSTAPPKKAPRKQTSKAHKNKLNTAPVQGKHSVPKTLPSSADDTATPAENESSMPSNEAPISNPSNSVQ